MTRATGLILNPNLELLFKGPVLRQFSFTYNLYPRTEAESKAAAAVIRFFKQGSAPIRSKSNLFLKTPNTFKLTYIQNTDKKFLPLIKECACTNVSVNYTPTGNYATYKDGGMVGYTLTLSFRELEPVFNDDYGMQTESLIGY